MSNSCVSIVFSLFKFINSWKLSYKIQDLICKMLWMKYWNNKNYFKLITYTKYLFSLQDFFFSCSKNTSLQTKTLALKWKTIWKQRFTDRILHHNKVALIDISFQLRETHSTKYISGRNNSTTLEKSHIKSEENFLQRKILYI